MQKMTYNGWSNRATWLVNIWYEPQTVSDIEYIEDTVEREFNIMIELKYGNNGHFFTDLIDFTEMDWIELKEAMRDNEKGEK